MPGGRLTFQERERIAAGLAEGLGYTEIGRQLDRPTSTISREVTRNGGPGRYRADRAHRATALRARRGSSPAGPHPSATFVVDNPEIRDFAARFTDLLVTDGMPRMQARILTCLHLTDSGGLTVAELVRWLEVSPASISTAVAALEKRDIIRRVRDKRRDRYCVDEGTWHRATLNLARATEDRVRVARRGSQVLGASTPAGVRLEEMSSYLEFIADEMIAAIDRWHRRAPRER
ncbi:helix-turn-helix domain-containing protein [Nocardia takedensis]